MSIVAFASSALVAWTAAMASSVRWKDLWYVFLQEDPLKVVAVVCNVEENDGEIDKS